jgi:hypothetical protein
MSDVDTNGGKRGRRNKRWPAALKREIVAATYLPGSSVSVVVRIPTKPDSDSDRCRTAIRRKPDSDPNEAGQQLDEAGHYRPSTAH